MVEQNIPGDMSAHEAEGLIKLIQKFVLLNMIVELNLVTHIHPIKSKIQQGNLHINPPINVFEGCKDLGYES